MVQFAQAGFAGWGGGEGDWGFGPGGWWEGTL
jgi:hypothetical protein